MMMRTMDPAMAIPATALSSSRRVTAIMAIHMDRAFMAIMAAVGKPFRARGRGEFKKSSCSRTEHGGQLAFAPARQLNFNGFKPRSASSNTSPT